MGKMHRKQMVGDRTKIAEKMSMHMMLMGYNGDYKSMLSQELNSRLWKRNGKLSRKRMRRFHFLLFTADSPTLLSFTVALGRLIWSNKLMAKRRNFEKKLSEKIKEWSVKKKKRRGKPGKLRARKLSLKKEKRKKRKEYVVVPKIVFGFQMRQVLGSRLRLVIKRKMRRQHSKSDHGSQMYRLAMAMKYLSLRNVYITSEWEFWTVCFVQEVTGFWGSIALQEDLSNSLSSVAKEFGLYVVSADHLERLESGFGCSSSLRCVGMLAFAICCLFCHFYFWLAEVRGSELNILSHYLFVLSFTCLEHLQSRKFSSSYQMYHTSKTYFQFIPCQVVE